MRVALTGASGFLGGALSRALAPAHEIVPIDGDVRSAKTFEAIPRVDVAVHLAARSNVPESVRDPVSTWETNVTGTLHLLEWARRERVGRVVLVSSAHVYGRHQYSPIDEAHPTHPVSPYGASKLGAEALARAYAASYGMDVVIVRPFNVYGPGQGPGFLIPDILRQLREGKTLVLGDARPVRDFTYVDDATAMLAICVAAPGLGGEVFNLGSGQGHSVGDVVAAALRVAGSPLTPTYDPSRFRAVETTALVVDNRHAMARLGWAPKVPLDEGLRRTWQAMRG